MIACDMWRNMFHLTNCQDNKKKLDVTQFEKAPMPHPKTQTGAPSLTGTASPMT